MKETLAAGLTHRFEFEVPPDRQFSAMPEVFATGFMVGLIEWTCLRLLELHLDEGEGSLGTHIDVSHKAATLPGMVVTVDVECVEVRGPRVKFAVKANDGVDEIGAGTHERFIVRWDRFNRGLAAKSGVAA